MLRRTLCLYLAASAACSQHASLRQKAPAIDVSPNPIQFQPLAVGKSALLTVDLGSRALEELLEGDDKQRQA